ncbi:PP2C family serine/threonine-protein phosphatase [Synechocystis sp. PCC 7509]|uniref:PP2C family serine/threonine-protein phosphatase n=1 Tax=Synechocystis sp. PCC 7509 TaxID=927677 RepID=UPI0002AC64A4
MQVDINQKFMQTDEPIVKNLDRWRVVAASVLGKSHEKVKQHCQDAHHWELLPEGVLVAAVADGAGSASLGKVGAIVASQTAVETIRLQYAISKSAEDENDLKWQLLLSNALEAAKKAVEEEAFACKVAARELATTLIIVVATSNLIAAVQVGDGVAVGCDRTGNMIALTAPQRGEYANETIFLVSPHALENIQVNVWRGVVANIAMLSDGLQMLALEMSGGKPHAPFFFPMFQFVADVTDEGDAQEQLVAFLRSERISTRTDDDLTLLLATIVN